MRTASKWAVVFLAAAGKQSVGQAIAGLAKIPAIYAVAAAFIVIVTGVSVPAVPPVVLPRIPAPIQLPAPPKVPALPKLPAPPKVPAL